MHIFSPLNMAYTEVGDPAIICDVIFAPDRVWFRHLSQKPVALQWNSQYFPFCVWIFLETWELSHIKIIVSVYRRVIIIPWNRSYPSLPCDSLQNQQIFAKFQKKSTIGALSYHEGAHPLPIGCHSAMRVSFWLPTVTSDNPYRFGPSFLYKVRDLIIRTFYGLIIICRNYK